MAIVVSIGKMMSIEGMQAICQGRDHLLDLLCLFIFSFSCLLCLDSGQTIGVSREEVVVVVVSVRGNTIVVCIGGHTMVGIPGVSISSSGGLSLCFSLLAAINTIVVG